MGKGIHAHCLHDLLQLVVGQRLCHVMGVPIPMIAFIEACIVVFIAFLTVYGWVSLMFDLWTWTPVVIDFIRSTHP